MRSKLNYQEEILRNRLQKSRIEQEVQEAKKLLSEIDLETLEKCRTVLQTLSEELYNNISLQISEKVNLCISAIFPSIEFRLETAVMNGKLRYDFIFTNNGVEIDPVEDCGGGVVDIISFALRVTLLSLMKNERILLLDEPWKWVSKDYLPALEELLRSLSKDIQFIIITHEESLISSADNKISL